MTDHTFIYEHTGTVSRKLHKETVTLEASVPDFLKTRKYRAVFMRGFQKNGDTFIDIAKLKETKFSEDAQVNRIEPVPTPNVSVTSAIKNVKDYLKGFTAFEILTHAYPGTIESLIKDFQTQINDTSIWKEDAHKHGVNLSANEIYELNKDITKKTLYIKALLEFYASYNHPSDEMHNLCHCYGIKTFRDLNKAFESDKR